MNPSPALDQPGMLPPQSGSGWAAAVFVARESLPVLQGTLAALGAALPAGACVDVLVNGNPELVGALRNQPQHREWTGAGHRLRYWAIALGDKANAWNEYVHRIWPGAACTFFVDGYARVRPHALSDLAQVLARQPQALAATGVPSSGPSAERLSQDLQQHGGLHGNLFALRDTTLQAMRERGLRLPLGIYRTDSTLGAAMAFGLNPPEQAWDVRRYIAVTPLATWTTPPVDLLSGQQLALRWRRRLRQAQGELENWAVRYHWLIERRPVDSLEATVEELVQAWALRDPQGLRDKLKEHPLHRWAWHRLRRGGPVARAPGLAQPLEQH